VSHDHWLEMAAAYALDALDPEDRTDFETHLSACLECRQSLLEFRDVAGLIAHAAPARTAPAALAPTVTAALRRSRRGRPFFARPPWLAAAAGIALAVTGGIVARRAFTETRQLESRLSELRADIAVRDSGLANLLGPRVHMVTLAPPGGSPVARVFWNHEQSRFVVTTFGLSRPEPGRTWQLWAIPERGNPVSMGTFDLAADIGVAAVLPVSAEIENLGLILSCGLTQEPAGGSPGPTETPRFIGNWVHAD
jgi:anti-sigma-K factor RskA